MDVYSTSKKKFQASSIPPLLKLFLSFSGLLGIEKNVRNWKPRQRLWSQADDGNMVAVLRRIEQEETYILQPFFFVLFFKKKWAMRNTQILTYF